jgi:hypothetical protein
MGGKQDSANGPAVSVSPIISQVRSAAQSQEAATIEAHVHILLHVTTRRLRFSLLLALAANTLAHPASGQNADTTATTI